MFDLTGKKVIVTGAAQGLGLGMAEGFLESGCRVVLTDISERLNAEVEAFCKKGYSAYGIVSDIGKDEFINAMWSQAMGILGGIDVLVTAAGIQRRHPAEEFPEEDWNAVININLTAVFKLNQLAGKEMIKQGSGKIINIASMLSYFGGITIPAYAAAKGGIAQLTKALGNEWASKGINVNALAPGYMLTDMNTNLLKDEGRYTEITARIPAHKWGKPDDMKGPALFLASSASDYLSGAIIPVDGGYLVR
jgi:Dehydrogenases with different specificities (related to short-chain alcohol dehydrogenases)